MKGRHHLETEDLDIERKIRFKCNLGMKVWILLIRHNRYQWRVL